MTTDAPLPDGTYDALVIDATAGTRSGSVSLDLTILGGEHKGEVVQVATDDVGDDPILLLGIPATLVVSSGKPRVDLEP